MAGVVGAGSRQIVAVAPDIENVQRERRFIQGVFQRDEPLGHLHRRVHWWHERVRASQERLDVVRRERIRAERPVREIARWKIIAADAREKILRTGGAE